MFEKRLKLLTRLPTYGSIDHDLRIAHPHPPPGGPNPEKDHHGSIHATIRQRLQAPRHRPGPTARAAAAGQLPGPQPAHLRTARQPRQAVRIDQAVAQAHEAPEQSLGQPQEPRRQAPRSQARVPAPQHGGAAEEACPPVDPPAAPAHPLPATLTGCWHYLSIQYLMTLNI